MRDIQIKNSDRITELEMWKLNKETKNVKGRTRQASQTMLLVETLFLDFDHKTLLHLATKSSDPHLLNDSIAS